MHIELIPTANAPTGAGQMATPLVQPAVAGAIRPAHRQAPPPRPVHTRPG